MEDCYPKGYRSVVFNAGIKDDTLDLGVVHSEKPAHAAAVFTTNKIKGNPVLIGQKHIKKGFIQTLVVNSKNSNVATGQPGYDDAMEIVKKVKDELGLEKTSLVFPSSTGVIGRRMPVDKIKLALDNLKAKLPGTFSYGDFARAIMTTDTVPKYLCARIDDAVLVGVAKGSGMIEPNMATMLSYFFTDADISSKDLDKILRRGVDMSFNAISIDSDMSTSDTVLLMANGMAGPVSVKKFARVFNKMAIALAKMIVTDGEGVTKMLICDVNGAKNDGEAKKIAKSIINSPLVKTAIYQGDPNWGRIFMAVGKTPDVKVNPDKLKIFWGKPPRHYKDAEMDQLHEYLKSNSELRLTVDLGVGKGSFRAYGCDLTEEYVKINAYYTT